MIPELEKVAEEEYQKFKKEIDYFIKVTEEYWLQLKTIFNPNNEIPNEQIGKLLFEKTKNIIQELQSYCSAPHISHVKYLDMGHTLDDPVTLLGWIKWETPKGIGEGNTYTGVITQKGLELLNGLRKLRRQYSVEEANQRFWERWRRAQGYL